MTCRTSCETEHFISHRDTLISYITAPSVGKNSKLKARLHISVLKILLSVQWHLYFSNRHLIWTHYCHTHTQTLTPKQTHFNIPWLHQNQPQYLVTKPLFDTQKSCHVWDTAHIHTQQGFFSLFSSCSESPTQNSRLLGGQAALWRPPLSRIDFLNVRVPDVPVAFPV